MSSWGRPTGFFLGSRPYRESRLRRIWYWLTDRHHCAPVRARCGGCADAGCRDCPTRSGPRSAP